MSPVSTARFDPYLSLLVSQALVEHQTFRLDAYRLTAEPPLDDYGRVGMILRHREGYFYYPPNGPSVLLVPVVAAAMVLGYDMQRAADNAAVQRAVSSLIAAAIFLGLYAVACCWLARREALGVVAVGVLGSSLTSTVGTAVWNLGFAALFMTLAIWLIIRLERGRGETLHPYWLGALLFAAFASRPTTATFIAPALIFVGLRHQRFFLRTSGAALTLLLLLGVSSWLTYGAVLPPYYDVLGRVGAHAERDFVGVLLGQTVSPSRGLFVFSPFLFVFIALLAWRPRQSLRQPAVWLCLVWFLLHLVMSARSTRWWGGHSYGPRLMTDAVPALIVAGTIMWHEIAPTLTRRSNQIVVTVFLVLGAVSIWIHSGQGLFNVHTQRWNYTDGFNVDDHPEALTDWQYPQFLATAERNCARNAAVVATQLQARQIRLDRRTIDSPIDYRLSTPAVLFRGWGVPETGFRWSQCREAAVSMHLDGQPPVTSYRLSVTAASSGAQTVDVSINGSPIGRLILDTPVDVPVTTFVEFDGRLLHPDAINHVTFSLPDARKPVQDSWGLGDQRLLALALVEMHFEPSPP